MAKLNNETLLLIVALLGLFIAADAASGRSTFADTMIKRITENGLKDSCVAEHFVQNVGYQSGCIPGTSYNCCEGLYCEPRSQYGYWTFYCTSCDNAWNKDACHEAINK